MKRVAITSLTVTALLGCDRVRWHRFIVPDPLPDRVFAQYSNADCEPFPIDEKMVVIEYDRRGCACTSESEDGSKWGPGAFAHRKPDGSLEVLENVGEIGASTTHYDDLLQITSKVLRSPDVQAANLASFMEQCAHLPGIDELSQHESIVRVIQTGL